MKLERPFEENVALSKGAAEHACYLVKNGPSDAADFHIYEMTIDGAAHTENPNNEYFTGAGRDVLHTYDAVVVIPRRPLIAGHTYRVSIKTESHSFVWSFSVRRNRTSLGYAMQR